MGCQKAAYHRSRLGKTLSSPSTLLASPFFVFSMHTPLPSEATHALEALQRTLHHNLHSVYLHGSAVTQGLRPRSDVDILACINRPLSVENRAQLARALLAISGHYPTDPQGRRPLEVMVFVLNNTTTVHYPACCEFMYGEWLRAEVEKGILAGPESNPEFTLILAQAARAVTPLYSTANATPLPAMAASDIQRAMHDLLPSLVASVEGDERNVLLTLARMWYTTCTGEFTSKDQAALWAAERLPSKHAELLLYAREGYLHTMSEDWQSKQTALLQTVSLLEKHILQALP